MSAVLSKGAVGRGVGNALDLEKGGIKNLEGGSVSDAKKKVIRRGTPTKRESTASGENGRGGAKNNTLWGKVLFSAHEVCVGYKHWSLLTLRNEKKGEKWSRLT